MANNYLADDPILGQIDLDDKFITDAWLIDQFVGSNLFSWASNAFGQLGNGNITSSSSPVQVGSLTNWKQIVPGDSHMAAIKTDGTLWTCGYNFYGQLGNNSRIYYSSPIQIGALTTWKQVYSGFRSTYAVKTDGTLWAWGYNVYGVLGNNTIANYSSPIQIGTLTTWKQVTVSGSNFETAFAIKTDGTLWGWGNNTKGQIGNNTSVNYSSPVQIGSLTNWKFVAGCGYGTTAAIKNDGTLWTWGNNVTYGALGVPGSPAVSSPIQVGSLTNWKQIFCGYSSVFAIKTDGTLWGWGSNTNGLLGNGTTVNYSSPIQIGQLTNWKALPFCGYSPLVIKTDGTLWGWGYNATGLLGNGTTVNYSSPIQIGSLSNWKSICSGISSSYGLTFKDLG